VVIDAVRCAKLAMDRDISGTLEGPSAYFMKSPPIQHHDEVARELVEAFIMDDGRPSTSGNVQATGGRSSTPAAEPADDA
jgi:myo-inositol-1-phosphate synthase